MNPAVPTVSSFYWPMQCMSSNRRAHMQALYAFCRAIDDVADATLPTDIKQAQLTDWAEEIDRLYRHAPSHPITQKLLPSVTDDALPKACFTEMIEGMRMDVTGQMHAPDMAVLQQYCYRVASCVGLLSVRIFGCRTAQSDEFAAALGHALQLTNIARDIIEDAARGRIYLAREWFDAAQIPVPDCAAVMAQPALLQPVLSQLWDEAERNYVEAERLSGGAERHLLLPALLMRDMYRKLHCRMKEDGWRYRTSYRSRPSDKLYLLWRLVYYKMK